MQFNKWTFMCSMLLLLGTAPATADDTKLPEAKQILSQYFRAIGGEEKLATVKATQSEFTLSIAGSKGTATVTSAGGGKFLYVMELEGLGSDVTGSDGKISWNKSLITGTRLIEGAEAEQNYLSYGSPIPHLNYAKHFQTMTCTGIEKFDGVDCYVLKYARAERKPQFDYFEKSTGLLRGSRQNLIIPQGEIEVQYVISDYRDVDGVKLPFANRVVIGPGQSMDFTITAIKINPKIDASLFDIPEEVKALKK